MGFHDVRFPVSISWGSRHAAGYKHEVIELPTGAEEIVSTQTLPRWRFDVAEGVKSAEQAVELRKFHLARHGISNSFRFKDWSDYNSTSSGTGTVATSDQNIGTGTGSATQFQLRKTYGDAGATEYRTITKPVTGTVLISVGGVAQTSPGWSFPWSVDTTTGIVTFTTAPTASAAVTAGYEFDCEVRFDEEGLDISQDAYESNSLRVPLIEKFPAAPVEDKHWYGNAAAITSNVAVTLSKATGRDVTFTPSAAHNVFLPPKGALPLGGVHFILHNASGTHAVTLKDGDDLTTTIGTLTATGGATPHLIVTLGLTSANARRWYAMG